MLEFLKGPFLVLHPLPDDVICNIAIYADDATLYCKCDHASDLWEQLELAFDLNLIYETLDWGRKWLVDFSNHGHPMIFFETPSSKLMPPMGHPPSPIKNDAPH